MVNDAEADERQDHERARRIAEAIDRFARLIDSIEWIGAGDSIRRTERTELQRLIERYPDLAEELLGRVNGQSSGGGPTDTAKDGGAC